MPGERKVNRSSFSYFFTVSFLSLLSVFVFFVVPLLSSDPFPSLVSEREPQQLPVEEKQPEAFPEEPEGEGIHYKVKFKGVDVKPQDDSEQSMRVRGMNCAEVCTGNFIDFTDVGTNVNVDEEGVYHGFLKLNDDYLGKQSYKICFKAPKHLQKCFNDVTLSLDSVLDFTSQPLEPGDLPLPQDGKVDENDFNYLWNHRGTTNSEELKVGDLNLDGVINTGDISLLLNTLSVRYDEEGW